MHPNLLIWLGVVALLVYFFIAGRRGMRAITRAFGTSNAMNAVMAAYRNGDYITALKKTEGLKIRPRKDWRILFPARWDVTSLGAAREI